jgi:hypothetical protein
MDLFGQTGSDAEFSECGNYRYWLKREWDSRKEKIMFIGLNPSTANAVTDDPTIRRVRGFARDWGYGGVYMLNLFAIVSPDPKVLVSHADPVGEFCDHFLRVMSKEVRTVAFAWGAFPEARKREQEVIAMFPDAICLKKTAAGNPGHPLYVKADIEPVYFNTNEVWTPPSKRLEIQGNPKVT